MQGHHSLSVIVVTYEISYFWDSALHHTFYTKDGNLDYMPHPGRQPREPLDGTDLNEQINPCSSK
jgi:hypothetical protein